MENFNAKDVKLLRDETGCGLIQCKEALKKCSCRGSAVEYLRINGSAVVRYKRDINGDKKPFTDYDYIMLAEQSFLEKMSIRVKNFKKEENNFGVSDDVCSKVLSSVY